jgi:hypothetical protein
MFIISAEHLAIALPFLRRANLFLVPLLLLLIGYVISLSGYNIPQLVLHAYFK